MVIRYNAEEEEMWVGGAEQRESSGERERWFRVRGILVIWYWELRGLG